MKQYWGCVLLGLLLISGCGYMDGPQQGPLTPEEALKAFVLEDGFEITLFAAEPDVIDPVALCFDEAGNAYVAEMRDYEKPGLGESFTGGRIRMLVDSDGDGRVDRSTIFADGLSMCHGVMPWDGGLVVACAPDLLFFRDTDGDGVADEKSVLYTGFALGNPQHRVNNPTFGHDNWIYLAANSGGEVTDPRRPGAPAVELRRANLRYHPVTGVFEAVSGYSNGYGIAVNDAGAQFVTHNEKHIQHVAVPRRYLERNPWLIGVQDTWDISDHGRPSAAVFRISPSEPWRAQWMEHRLTVDEPGRWREDQVQNTGYFTSASGVHAYRGGQWPAEYHENVIVCESAGNIVHRDIILPDGAGYRAARAPENQEFIMSTDTWFRPCVTEIGPDGALYIVDFYREVIEHQQYIPDHIHGQMDLAKGSDYGRIWRVTWKGQSDPVRPRMHEQTSSELVPWLNHANAWWRETARRVLLARQDTDVIPLVQAALRDNDRPQGRKDALWMLDGLNGLRAEDVAVALQDPAPIVRESAIRLAEEKFPSDTVLRQAVLDRRDDDNPRVRMQTAFSLGAYSQNNVLSALADIAKRDAADPLTRIAVLSAVGDRAPALLAALCSDAAFTGIAAEGKTPLLTGVAAISGLRADVAGVDQMLNVIAGLTGESAQWARVAVLAGLGNGLTLAETKLSPPSRISRSLRTLIAGGSIAVRDGAETLAAVLDLAEFAVTEADIQNARPIAMSETETLDRRLEAVRVLGRASFEIVKETLDGLLDPRHDNALQLAAVDALRKIKDPAAGPLLTARFNAYAPAMRERVLATLFSNSELLVHLIDAMEANQIDPTLIDPLRRQQLLSWPESTVRARAQNIFTRPESEEDDSSPQDETFRAVLALQGHPEAGRAVFGELCVNCHKLGGEGFDVGPDLTTVMHNDPTTLLENILTPNADMDEKYADYIIETKDGLIITGMIANDSRRYVILRRAGGIQATVLRRNIASMRTTGVSLMPVGLTDGMPPQMLADLIAFIRTGGNEQ